MQNHRIKHIDLFSGIGGFALAADRVFADVEHIFCDNEPFAQEVLTKHWPNSKIYGDIRTLTNTNDAGLQETRSEQSTTGSPRENPFLLTGGFPCQPFSQAGRRKGTDDNRYLWPEMLRVIQEFKPTWVIAENVRGLLSINGGLVFEQVCTDLENAGYEVQPIVIPAVAVNAPHRRDRVWFIAHRRREHGGTGGDERVGTDTTERTSCESDTQRRREDGRSGWHKNWPEVAQRFCQLDDGIPYRLAGFRLDETCAIMGYILLLRNNFYGKKDSTRTEEILLALQRATTPQAFSELLRGYWEIQKEKILRCSVHGESNDERECKPWSLLSKSEKIQRKEMRRVWHDELAKYPPYQRELERQCSCQFDDIVRELSSPIALAEWENNAKKATSVLFSLWQKSGGARILHEPLQALQEVWESLTDKEIGSFRRHYYRRNDNRNPRLKALGNAIVPAVAEEIMKAIQNATRQN